MTIVELIEKVSDRSPMHAKRLEARLDLNDKTYLSKAQDFLTRYGQLLDDQNLDMDYAVDCYFDMVGMVVWETKEFLHTGKYRYTSFDEVNKLVYSNQEYMTKYMHGLIMSIFLWQQHYKMFDFFSENLAHYKSKIKRYLEIGGGHGLFLKEANDILGDQVEFTAVDISQSSLELCQALNKSYDITYVHSDIYEFHPEHKFDFITMGEVLEHVEEPVELMKKLYDLCADDGTVYITVPTNAPTIDHIALFNDANDIIQICQEAGFKVEKDFSIYSEDVTPEVAEKKKIAMMYACFLTKNK